MSYLSRRALPHPRGQQRSPTRWRFAESGCAASCADHTEDAPPAAFDEVSDDRPRNGSISLGSSPRAKPPDVRRMAHHDEGGSEGREGKGNDIVTASALQARPEGRRASGGQRAHGHGSRERERRCAAGCGPTPLPGATPSASPPNAVATALPPRNLANTGQEWPTHAASPAAACPAGSAPSLRATATAAAPLATSRPKVIAPAQSADRAQHVGGAHVAAAEIANIEAADGLSDDQAEWHRSDQIAGGAARRIGSVASHARASLAPDNVGASPRGQARPEFEVRLPHWPDIASRLAAAALVATSAATAPRNPRRPCARRRTQEPTGPRHYRIQRRECSPGAGPEGSVAFRHEPAERIDSPASLHPRLRQHACLVHHVTEAPLHRGLDGRLVDHLGGQLLAAPHAGAASPSTVSSRRRRYRPRRHRDARPCRTQPGARRPHGHGSAVVAPVRLSRSSAPPPVHRSPPAGRAGRRERLHVAFRGERHCREISSCHRPAGHGGWPRRATIRAADDASPAPAGRSDAIPTSMTGTGTPRERSATTGASARSPMSPAGPGSGARQSSRRW